MSFNPDDYKVVCTPLSTVTLNGEVVEWDLLSNKKLIAPIKGGYVVLDGDTGHIYTDIDDTLLSTSKVVDNNVDAVIKEPTPLASVVVASPEIQLASAIANQNNYVECSCGSCGAPMSIHKASVEEYKKASNKNMGGEFMNFTDDEIGRHYNIDLETIDNVIYDDSRMCSECR